MNCPSNILLKTQDSSLLTLIPNKQLLSGSLQVSAPEKKFSELSSLDHENSYLFIQKIANVWKQSHFTDQYLLYAKVDEKPFHWEMVPYQKCRTFIGRAVQQIQVLWRTIFGGIEISKQEMQDQVQNFTHLLRTFPEISQSLDVPSQGSDSFCKTNTIDRQWVITGDKVNVLFNYAPIGFGGERLHFLVVPKNHRETFTDVTKDEYSESMTLTNRLIDHFTENRKTVENAYLLHKTGIDAGQTVKHWHLHVIFSMNKAQDIWGKFTVFKNILLGSSPMKKEDLALKVNSFREELNKINI